MPELLDSLWQLVLVLGDVLWNLLVLAAHWSLLIAWVAWWLFAVNWRRAWAVLEQGAWVPVVLLVIVSSLVWAGLDPVPHTFLGVPVPNFWWQLGGVSLLVGVTLFCGWLQGVFNLTPHEISLEPPPHADGHHGHAAHH